MRYLRAIRGVTLHDRPRNDDIREQLGAMPTITEVIRERETSQMVWPCNEETGGQYIEHGLQGRLRSTQA